MSYINENITCPQLLKRKDKKNENKRNMLELSIYLLILSLKIWKQFKWKKCVHVIKRFYKLMCATKVRLFKLFSRHFLPS